MQITVKKSCFELWIGKKGKTRRELERKCFFAVARVRPWRLLIFPSVLSRPESNRNFHPLCKYKSLSSRILFYWKKSWIEVKIIEKLHSMQNCKYARWIMKKIRGQKRIEKEPKKVIMWGKKISLALALKRYESTNYACNMNFQVNKIAKVG